jgi:predicted transcriptional regulator
METINVMLKLALNGMRKTHIMYGANLSYTQLTKYLDILVKSQLLTRQQGLYITTERGRSFIDAFYEIQYILGETPTSQELRLDARFS